MAREQEEPDEPSELPGRSWPAILKRTVKEFREDDLTDWAAALTYYGVMSLFPMLIVLVDRKSTRLNSSHVKISYAVFCLKKKKKKKKQNKRITNKKPHKIQKKLKNEVDHQNMRR